MLESLSLVDEQQKFAQQMMALEGEAPKKAIIKITKRVQPACQPHRKRIVKRRTIRDIQRDVAEAAGLTLTLEAYDASKSRYEGRSKIFDTRCFASVRELTGGRESSEAEKAAEEERRFVQFLIAERKRMNDWIEAQHFPIVEYTEEDEEDELREKEAKTIFFNHTHQQ